MLILVLRVFNCCCLLKYECLGCRFFFSISRKNCKIIFHWFHFSRITFFFRKKKNKLHLHKQLSCKQIFGRSTKNQSLRLVTYKVLQFARRLHTLSHTEQHFHSKNQKGGVASNLLRGAGVKKKTLTRSYKKAKMGNHHIENQNELPIVFEKCQQSHNRDLIKRGRSGTGVGGSKIP